MQNKRLETCIDLLIGLS